VVNRWTDGQWRNSNLYGHNQQKSLYSVDGVTSLAFLGQKSKKIVYSLFNLLSLTLRKDGLMKDMKDYEG
jgi:hypothetical protein